MLLEGSCHCGAVTFSLQCDQPVPYQRCYCSICRKTAGGGGFAINLGGDAKSLRLQGRKHVHVYHARMGKRERSTAERHFCGECGSALYLFSPEWPELIHPFASAIDTDLPIPPDHTHLMVGSKADWVEVDKGKRDLCFAEYPKESIAAWHQRHGIGGDKN